MKENAELLTARAPNEIFGRLTYDHVADDEYKFFTANSFIASGGRLVMGAGAALACKTAYPGVDLEFGAEVLFRTRGRLDYYVCPLHSHQLGALQVKRHYADKADIELIEKSLLMLAEFALDNRSYVIHCNYPGIGNGGIAYGRVRALVKSLKLPKNIYLWRYKT